jgi:GntR family transcriptional regulator/MocR family aminotransferase
VLAIEGYIVGRGAAGTMVAPHVDRVLPLSGVAASSAQVATGHLVAPFQMGLPALDAFPWKL